MLPEQLQIGCISACAAMCFGSVRINSDGMEAKTRPMTKMPITTPFAAAMMKAMQDEPDRDR